MTAARIGILRSFGSRPGYDFLLAEHCAARRDALRERLMLSSTLTPVETVYGRVTECAVIGNLPVSGDDRRTHTRLVVEIEPTGYRS